MKLNTHWALTIYPVIKDENSNGSDEKLHKKTNRTNITATNFVWEQLKNVNNMPSYHLSLKLQTSEKGEHLIFPNIKSKHLKNDFTRMIAKILETIQCWKQHFHINFY